MKYAFVEWYLYDDDDNYVWIVAVPMYRTLLPGAICIWSTPLKIAIEVVGKWDG